MASHGIYFFETKLFAFSHWGENLTLRRYVTVSFSFIVLCMKRFIDDVLNNFSLLETNKWWGLNNELPLLIVNWKTIYFWGMSFQIMKLKQNVTHQSVITKMNQTTFMIWSRSSPEAVIPLVPHWQGRLIICILLCYCAAGVKA